MTKKFIILSLVAALIGITAIIILYQKNVKSRKEISSLKSKIGDLEDDLSKAQEEVADLENKVSDLEDNVSDIEDRSSEVKQFDNSGGVRHGLSSNSATPSYTGKVLKTQIDGDFEGWEGETIFKMTNGTIWQQSSYAYTYHYSFMPEVIIYKKDGTYYMKVEDVDDEIAVEQIK
ncbi:MAG: hypothetical protein ABIO55_07960 [Ginsengibacter sp.]